jgi:oxalate decarboxylase/phosphoglucose isomerase-like protein (cupin superfamily)
MLLPTKIKNDRLILSKDLIFSLAERKIKELKPYLYERSSVKKGQEDKTAYLMYRNCCYKKHENLFITNNLRYDVTLIYPLIFNKEFNKTLGHWHKTPEIYEVLSGKALFLLQGPKNSAKEIYFQIVQKNSKIIIPPFYNHLIINLSNNKPLIVADIFSNQVKSHYSYFKQKHGAAYYILNSKLKNQKSKLQFKIQNLNVFAIKNLNYKKVSNLKKFKNPEIISSFKKPLYLEFIENPKKFNFLIN